ncbi:MAG TPA: hypothetical protein ENG78_00365 [Acidiferrobacteraceae bacterium]|nr:hypothetical protein [Acidiferrobacteraceae bacterium]HEX19270.1 hypothetical protein [Acidiferrobacteraceae bacterium]
MMFLCTRKPGQGMLITLDETLPWRTPVGLLFVDAPIKIMVHQVINGDVRLSIRAHPSLRILSKELGY